MRAWAELHGQAISNGASGFRAPLMVVGMVLEDATPREGAWFMITLPSSRRLLWRAIGSRWCAGYSRHIRRNIAQRAVFQDCAAGHGSIDARVQYLADRIEIQDVIARYGLGQDLHEDGDNDVRAQWDEVFTPDGVADYSSTGVPELASIGFRELVDFMRRPGGSMSGLKRWQHFQGWATVTIDGDTATARTPLTARCSEGVRRSLSEQPHV